jgi:hypothetical protein
MDSPQPSSSTVTAATPTHLSHPLSQNRRQVHPGVAGPGVVKDQMLPERRLATSPLKSQSQPDDASLANGATWDGSVRGFGSRNVDHLRGRDHDVSAPSISSIWDRSASRQAPVIVVEQPDSSHNSTPQTSPARAYPSNYTRNTSA